MHLPFELANIKHADHPRLRMPFDGAGERETPAGPDQEAKARASARLDPNELEPRRFDLHAVIDHGHKRAAQNRCVELVRDLPSVRELNRRGHAGGQPNDRRTKRELVHVDANYRRRECWAPRMEHEGAQHGNQQNQLSHVYLLLNGVSSGLNSPNTPFGLGYQIHRCSVTSGGCQKLNAAPVLEFVFAHRDSADARTNEPST